jgi:3-hydroxyisobutyrate dehydrogenase-like beta-hydroxyacid dehydrogenase
MGSRIVTLLLDAGHHLTVWARRPASLEPFGGRCDLAASPAAVGETSELVGICVWDDHDVDEVLLGADGVFSGLRPGGVVAVHSTIFRTHFLLLASRPLRPALIYGHILGEKSDPASEANDANRRHH